MVKMRTEIIKIKFIVAKTLEGTNVVIWKMIDISYDIIILIFECILKVRNFNDKYLRAITKMKILARYQEILKNKQMN